MELGVRGVAVFLFSVLLFHFVEIPFTLYLLLLVILYGAALYCYSDKHNDVFHRNLLVGIAGNAAAFLVASIATGRCFGDGSGVDAVVILFLLSILLPELRYGWRACRRPAETAATRPELYPERVHDLARLKRLLAHTPILGVKSTWGQGKSFLVDYFCSEEETKAQYHIIKIEALAYRYDEFDKILITKLDDLLRQNRIFSLYASEAMQTLGSHLWGRLLYHFFRGNESGSTSTFTGLKQEMDYLSKDVLIIFEDLERVGDPEAVKKLFAIAERLAGGRVRIIYEYDATQLQERLGLDWAYLEKYIPVEMNLTELSYETMVQRVWDDLQMDSVDRKILGGWGGQDTLKGMLLRLPLFLYNPFGIHLTGEHLQIDRHRATIRRVREFMIEVKIWAEKRPEREFPAATVRPVMAFFFVRNFMEDMYERLEPGKKLTDIFPFHYNQEEVSAEELCKALWVTKQNTAHSESEHDPAKFYERLNRVLAMKENGPALVVYALFDYHMYDYEKRIGSERNKQPLSTRDAGFMARAAEERERIDHIIWNLLQNGKSEYSDNHACADKFIREVLMAPEEEWDAAWQRFNNDLYHEHIFKDNTTINMFGRLPLVDIAKAVAFENPPHEVWERWVDFLGREWRGHPIDTDFIQICNTLDTSHQIAFLKMMDLFAGLPVSGNFNEYEPYRYFLGSYINRLAWFGYIDHGYYGSFSGDGTDYTKSDIWNFAVHWMQDMSQALQQHPLLDTEMYRKDVGIIADFLRKNIEILSSPVKSKERKPQVHIAEERVTYPHQKKMEEIVAMFRGKEYTAELGETVVAAIGEAYRERELYPEEVRKVKRELARWKEGKF